MQVVARDYNHGGWRRQPQNMIETLKKVKSDNVGMVYNFHHDQEHFKMISETLEMMLPWFYCVNLNGMDKNGPKILTLSQETGNRKIIKMIAESGYLKSILNCSGNNNFSSYL